MVCEKKDAAVIFCDRESLHNDIKPAILSCRQRPASSIINYCLVPGLRRDDAWIPGQETVS